MTDRTTETARFPFGSRAVSVDAGGAVAALLSWGYFACRDAHVAHSALEVSLRTLKASQDQAPPGKRDILVGREGVQELAVFVELADALVVCHRDMGPVLPAGTTPPGYRTQKRPAPREEETGRLVTRL